MSSDSKPFYNKTDWTFETSEGADAGMGLLFGLTASSGAIYVEKVGEDKQYKLNFIAGGASLSLPDGMPSFDFATADMFSTGVIYSNPLKSGMTLDEFSGVCLIYQGSILTVAGAGWSGTVIFFGAGPALVKGFIAACTGVGIPVAPAVVVASCRGLAAYTGESRGIPGAGVSGSLGYIFFKEAAQLMKPAFGNFKNLKFN